MIPPPLGIRLVLGHPTAIEEFEDFHDSMICSSGDVFF
jgi:hypothetical protein